MPEVQKQKIKPSTRLLAEKLPTPGVSGNSSPLTAGTPMRTIGQSKPAKAVQVLSRYFKLPLIHSLFPLDISLISRLAAIKISELPSR
jgi:hypothetical protein